MKKLMQGLAIAAMVLSLPAAGCGDRVNTAGSVAVQIAELEIDRAYVEHDKLVDRVRAARLRQDRRRFAARRPDRE